ncbi:Mitochondrial distribution and morphology protein 31, mitochondrial precursor, partial [Coemansia sp. RSA 1200]
DEIMRGISGVLPRLRARIRRALKGSYQKRPWTVDDIFALITWAVMSQAMLLLIGTTTTVSVALWFLNRLQYQDWIARHLSVWVSSALKITVSFQSAIVPAWRSGAIRLKNVKIRCGPEHGKTNEDGSRDTNFTMYDLQIDQIDVALSLWRWIEDRGLIRECSVRGVRGVVDRRMVEWDSNTIYLPDRHRQSHQPGYFNLDSLEIDDMLLTVHPWKNFRPVTMSIYSANLPLFRDRWLLYDLLCANSVVGMYDGSLFTIHQAHQHISPFKSLPASASHIYDSKALTNQNSRSSIQEPKLSVCQGRTSHVQIDNLNIDHINSGAGGPIGWITSGRLNVSSLISFPDNESSADPAAAIRKLVDNISDSIDVVILPSMPDWSTPESSPNPLVRMLYHLDMVDSPLAQGMHERLKRRAERESQRRLEKQRQRTASWSQPLAPITPHQIGSAMPSVSDTQGHSNTSPTIQLPNTHEDPNAVHVDLQVEFNGIRASVPLSTPQLGHPLLSSVLVRPIVGYMNAHRTSLPMRCQLRLKPDDFDGAWSLWDSGADNLITQGIGSAFAQLAQDERKRNRHLKLVGMWSVAAIVKHILRLVDFIYDRHAFFDYFSLSGEAEHM